jgi:hypothetical protein
MYQMKKTTTPMANNRNEYVRMANYILSILRGTNGVKVQGNTFLVSERTRQFWTWGATSFKYICAADGCYGIQFNVTGLKHRGRVRVYYNRATDYFDVEFLRARKEEMIYGVEDIDLEQLHNVCHRFIEREDDMEV